MSYKRKKIKKLKKATTTKKITWLLLSWGIACGSASYILAAFGKDPVSSLSEVIVGGTVLVVFGYFAKSLFEKREDFGSVGKQDGKE